MEVPLKQLPDEISLEEAVESAYREGLDDLSAALRAGGPLLVECDPELTPYLYRALRDRVSPRLRCRYLEGRPDGSDAGEERLADLVRVELREQIRGGDLALVLVLPHLGLLSGEADSREVAALLHDNPEMRVLAFHDRREGLPERLARAFPRRGGLGSVPCEALGRVVCRHEGRKFGEETLDLELLHRYAGELNALQLRRALEAVDTRLDYDPRNPTAREAILADLLSARA